MGIYEFDAELYEKVIKEESREEGRAEGKAEGRAEGKAESILELLEELGPVSDSLRRKIIEQKDPDTLKRWHKLSAKTETVEAFEKAVQ